MTFLAVGINYNTAPVSIRERLSFPADILESSLKDLSRVKDILKPLFFQPAIVPSFITQPIRRINKT